jgi:hypothetical protein
VGIHGDAVTEALVSLGYSVFDTKRRLASRLLIGPLHSFIQHSYLGGRVGDSSPRIYRYPRRLLLIALHFSTKVSWKLCIHVMDEVVES